MDSQSMRRTHLHSWKWKMRIPLMYFNNRLGAAAKGGHPSVRTVQTDYTPGEHPLRYFMIFPPNALQLLLPFVFFVFLYLRLPPPWREMGFVFNVCVREDKILDSKSDLLGSEQFQTRPPF
ncbi:hypothetical protein AAFF_G00211480 [Aldrovandia affinis]|uniref:Uncharacterized protein n=1 Tax=Aldrovandia affinis TaxID=143900 RepID=A0AAD7SXS5_9TELE|nr:hypothetical protein AAFF_G00211480 [Aldrovandia affinis]